MTHIASRPLDATLSVTKAARVLGVHPNTIRAWSDAGRLRYYRINPRGDRRYRMGDLQRFLAAAENVAELPARGGRPHVRRHGLPGGPGLSPQPALGRPWPGALPPPQSSADGVAERRPSHAAPSERADLRLIAELAALASEAIGAGERDLDRVLGRATRAIRGAGDHQLVAIWRLDGEELVPRASASAGEVRLSARPLDGWFDGPRERVADGHVVEARSADGGLTGAPELRATIATSDLGPWGVLQVVGHERTPYTVRDRDLAAAAARAIGAAVQVVDEAARLSRALHRAEALHRVASDIGSRLDLQQTLAAVVDHAMVLFGAQRGAVFSRSSDGAAQAEAARNLSPEFLAAVRPAPSPSITATAISERRPVFSVGYRDDPRGAAVRAAVVQEGFDTICSAPLFDGDRLLGVVVIFHDKPHPWTDADLTTISDLAREAAGAIRTAQNYDRMASWAAQLQAIQQLGVQLSRLTSVAEIGQAIATELRELIDSHNVRVYRLYGEDLIPVAMRGQIGEYVDETPEQLRLRVGEGITGWVAANRQAQYLPDAAHDPRASTVTGTQDDLDESMLLAPMIHEDQVLGVLVLSKLGLQQFRDDDLRLLEIFASFAAQAMANADSTTRLEAQSAALERQLRSQRELLGITESILSTLDPREVLDQIVDRIGTIVRAENIAIEAVDRSTGRLTPLTARGVHAAWYLEPWAEGETGLATWVLEHDEPVMVANQHHDDRINQSRDIATPRSGIIVVPLRSRGRATGVLTLERLADGDQFSNDEFELVQLFAAQVSIALQNAEAHHAVELQARTDALTGLLNHGTFRRRLAASVAAGEPFSLIMIDLDDFKAVNDALGHQAGDRFLADVAQSLVAAGRESDHLFRYGGDEFAIILPGADAGSATSVARRVLNAVDALGAEGTSWRADGVEVSASLGVASFPADGSAADELLLAADRACFVAKRSSGGRIATADEGLALASEFSLQEPTPVDPPSLEL